MAHRLQYMRRRRRRLAEPVEAAEVAAGQVPEGRLLLRIRRGIDHWVDRASALGSVCVSKRRHRNPSDVARDRTGCVAKHGQRHRGRVARGRVVVLADHKPFYSNPTRKPGMGRVGASGTSVPGAVRHRAPMLELRLERGLQHVTRRKKMRSCVCSSG